MLGQMTKNQQRLIEIWRQKGGREKETINNGGGIVHFQFHERTDSLEVYLLNDENGFYRGRPTDINILDYTRISNVKGKELR